MPRLSEIWNSPTAVKQIYTVIRILYAMDLSRFYKSRESPTSGLLPPPPTPDPGSVADFHSDMNTPSISPEAPTPALNTPSNRDRCANHADDASSTDGPSSGDTLRCVDEHHQENMKGISGYRRGDWPLLAKWNPALTLENSGSVARDHLASERTFLAYVRTSLTIASTGVGEWPCCSREAVSQTDFGVLVALVQLFTISAATNNKALEPWSRPMGAVVIALGLGTLCFGVTRFFSIQNALLGGNYPVARISTILLAVVLGVIIILVFGVLLGVRSRTT